METPQTNAPKSVWELFGFFSLLALQGFGGIVAFIEQGLVTKKRWMTREQFLEDWAVARTLPGPPAINMGIIFGSRHFGVLGAVVATVGMFLLPSLLVLVLAIGYATYGSEPRVIDALRGMGAVAAGMIIATGVKLLTALRTNVMGHKVCATFVVISFIAVVLLQVRVIHLLLVLGLVACSFAYWRITSKKVH